MEYSFTKHRIIGGTGADDEYWKGLEEGKFRLPRCAGCTRWMWPPNFRCGHCGSWDLMWIEMVPRGSVFTWTRSWYAFDRVIERAKDVPYVTILAELPEADGARVLGVMKGNETGLKIGAPVVGSIDPPSEKSKWYPAVRWELVR
jgi:uncharacterized OB-fold protein